MDKKNDQVAAELRRYVKWSEKHGALQNNFEGEFKNQEMSERIKEAIALHKLLQHMKQLEQVQKEKIYRYTFTFTHNPEVPFDRVQQNFDKWLTRDMGFKYICYSHEHIDTNHHIQGYVEMSKIMKKQHFKYYNPDGHVWWAKSKGNRDSNETYCSKEKNNTFKEMDFLV